MDLGNMIKELRERKGYTKYRLSELSGVSQTHISDIERSAKVPTIETVSRLIEPLGVSLAEFFANDNKLFDLNATEQEVMKLFRGLSPDSEDVVIKLLQLLSNNENN